MKRLSRKKLFLALFFLILVVGGLVWWKIAHGVTRTWDGGGVDGTCGGAGTANNWSCAANWSSDTAPTGSDIATFDATSTKNATIDANISVAGINIAAGYSGTITQSGSFTVTVGSSHYVQAAGTFTGGSAAITINGTFTLSGGTFTSTTGTLQIGYSASDSTVFTVSGGTFTHNNGTVKFTFGESGNTRTYTIDVVTSLTLYNVEWASTDNTNPDRLTTAAGDTIVIANNFTQSGGLLYGTWEVLGNVVIGSGADGGEGTLTYTGTGSKTYGYTTGGIGPHLRVNNAAVSVAAAGGTTDLSLYLFSLLAGTFTAPSGTLEIGYVAIDVTVFTVSGGTFTHNNGTVKFTFGESGNTRTYTIDVVTSLTLYDVEWASTDSTNPDRLTVAAGDTIIVSHNFTFTNGVLYGAWEVQGNDTIATTADGGTATLSFTGGNAQTFTNQGGVLPSGDVLVNKSAGTLTLASNAAWNAASQDLTITSGTLASATYNITTVNLTVNGGTFTGGSGTVTASGPMVVSSGTFTSGAGTVAVKSFSQSGGAFTAPTGTFEIGYVDYGAPNRTDVTISGGTFSHNNGTVKFVSGDNYTVAIRAYAVDVVTTLTLYNVEYNSAGLVGSLTTGSGDTVIVANNFTLTNGGLEGTWEVQGNVTIGSGADTSTGTLTYTGTGSKTYSFTAGGYGPHLRVNNAAVSVAAAAGTTALKISLFSLLAGTFTAPSGTLEIGYTGYGFPSRTDVTISGGTFNHNNGTVKFMSGDGYPSALRTYTVDVATTLTLYNVEWSCGDLLGDLSPGSGDTIIVVNDFTFTNGYLVSGTWEVQGNVVIGSGADGGSATLTYTGTGSKTYSYTAGGFGPHLRVNSAAVSVSAAAGTTALKITFFSLLAGTFTAPSGTLEIGYTTYNGPSHTDLTVSGGTFNHNNGTVKFISGDGYTLTLRTYTVDVATTLTLYNVEWSCGDLIGMLSTGSGDTVIVANNFTFTNGTLAGTWEVQGNYTVATTADGGAATITFTGGNTQIYTDNGGDEPDGNVTINKPANSVTLASNADWNAASQTLTITAGTLLQPSTYAVATGAVTVGASGKWVNNGTGAVTLGGGLANSGLVDFRTANTCGGTDSIALHSSVNGTQRAWSGTGTFVMRDIEVKDQGGSAAITAYSSTSTSGNGGNWTFNATCPFPILPKAGLSSGKMDMQTGKINLR